MLGSHYSNDVMPYIFNIRFGVGAPHMTAVRQTAACGRNYLLNAPLTRPADDYDEIIVPGDH